MTSTSMVYEKTTTQDPVLSEMVRVYAALPHASESYLANRIARAFADASSQYQATLLTAVQDTCYFEDFLAAKRLNNGNETIAPIERLKVEQAVLKIGGRKLRSDFQSMLEAGKNYIESERQSFVAQSRAALCPVQEF